jgi:hypothetical protein
MAYQKGKEGRRTIWPGPQAQSIYKLKKKLGDEIIFLNRTSSVNFKFDCKLKKLLQEYSNLDSLGCFLISPSNCIFLSVCLHQWLKINA